MFRFAVVASLLASASAFLGKVDPNSKELRKLLNDATLTEGRGLANNNYYQLNGEMAKLYVKYTGCSNLYSMAYGGQGGNNKNGNGQDAVVRSAVATFEIREECNGDLVGKYAAPMVTFTDTYTENIMTEQQWRCEQYIELYCDDCKDLDDDGACYTNCTSGKFDASGYDVSVCSSYIKNGNNNKEEFNVQRYLECGKMQGNNNNNNNNGNNNNGADYYEDAYAAYAAFDGKFRVGPYCNDNDGYSILLGIFYDQYCSVQAESKIYEEMYGAELPYSKSSIVPKNTCVACADPQKAYEQNQNQNNGNNNGQAVAREVCTTSYASAVKCEDTGSSYLTLYGATTSGCEFVSEYVPAVKNTYSADASSGSGKAGNAFAWIFAFTTLMFAGYAYFLYSKLRRGASTLASRDGTGALA